METTTSTSTDVIIHASFSPDGTCVAIEEQPAWLATANDWFKYLSRNTVNSYRPLQGGRGVFSITKAQLETLQTKQ